MDLTTPFSSDALTVPVLAVDLHDAALRGVLHLPGRGSAPAREYSCTFTSLDLLTADNLRDAVRRGRDVYIRGAGIGRHAGRALREHRDADLAVCLHPDVAAFLDSGSGLLESLGVTVSTRQPPGYESIAAIDFSPVFWNTLSGISSLPRPEVTLVSAVESGNPLDDDPLARSRALKTMFGALSRPCPGPGDGGGKAVDFSQGIPVEHLLSPRLRHGLLRLSAIQRLTGCPAADSALATALALLSQPNISERSWREGVTLLHLGRERINAALVFQERLMAFLELQLDKALPGGREAGAGTLLPLLDDFRLGWLPDETAADLGGCVWRIAELPPEAEGFKPTFVIGHDVAFMSGLARVMPPVPASAARCRGLLYGYSRMLQARE